VHVRLGVGVRLWMHACACLCVHAFSCGVFVCALVRANLYAHTACTCSHGLNLILCRAHKCTDDCVLACRS